MLTNAPRGTKDILPEEVTAWNFVEEKIRNVCKRYGFQEIRTPHFEHTELFHRGIGEGTDVVDKEMYTFEDRGHRSVTLRPENTASVVRAYLQNKLYGTGNATKLFYIGEMFRYDRPQAGRMREFHQFGVESIGQESPMADAEVILLAVDFLESLGLKDLQLSLNSVGCPKCRPTYRKDLQEFFRDKLGELCEDCNSRFERSPMRILDCKVDADKPFMKDAPKITDCLCEECQEHFHALQKYLAEAGISFTLDPRLVRGLDYYTRTAFEIKYAPLGAQSAVAGGGRYDGLIEEIGGAPTPAVGFATGLERVLLALTKQGLLPKAKAELDAFVIVQDEAASTMSFSLLSRLRRAGITASMDFAGRSMKAQFKQANKFNARYALILGKEECKESAVTCKDMQTGEQRKISLEEIVTTICSEVKH